MFNFRKDKALIFCFMQAVKLTNLENRFVEARKGHKALVKLNRIKDKLYKVANTTSKLSEEWTIFKLAKTKFKKALRNSKVEFSKKIVQDNATSTKKLWNCLNSS